MTKGTTKITGRKGNKKDSAASSYKVPQPKASLMEV